jgi:hypothetical protein
LYFGSLITASLSVLEGRATGLQFPVNFRAGAHAPMISLFLIVTTDFPEGFIRFVPNWVFSQLGVRI